MVVDTGSLEKLRNAKERVDWLGGCAGRITSRLNYRRIAVVLPYEFCCGFLLAVQFQ